MNHITRSASVLFAAILLIPLGVRAASAEGGSSLVVSDPGAGNAYAAGKTVTVIAPVAEDLGAVGGSVTVSAPVAGDALLAGVSVDVRKPVAGDLRVFGGRVVVEDAVAGDLVAGGGTVSINAAPAYTLVGGVQVDLRGGSKGPVTVYGTSITLSGVFNGDVRIVASDRISLAEGTIIHGILRYDAPQQADIPASAKIDGGVSYTGTSYLPTMEQARTFALAGAGIFLIVRILALIIAAGLLAGLFQPFSQLIADKVLAKSFGRFALLVLLGLGIVTAVPVLILLLSVTFAGFGVAIVLGSAFVLLLVLGYLFAGILAGSALSRALVKRSKLLWRDAVLGTLILSLVGIVPVIGFLAFLVLFLGAIGALAASFYRFAFPKEPDFDTL